MPVKKIALRSALGASLLLAAGGTAAALELNDLVIRFDVLMTGEDTDKDGTRPGTPFKNHVLINAIAGHLVWDAYVSHCDLTKPPSLVYKPGAQTGRADCPAVRKGTATNWREYGGTATYTTNTSVAGNMVTLKGTLAATGADRISSCGELRTYEHDIVVIQSLKLRIVGAACQVLEFSETVVDRRQTKGIGRDLDPKSSTLRSRLAPGAKCTVKRRSQEPITPPGPGLVSVTPDC